MSEEEEEGEVEALPPNKEPLGLSLTVGDALPPSPHPVLGVTLIDTMGVWVPPPTGAVPLAHLEEVRVGDGVVEAEPQEVLL